ncbi:MAG: hypothetical protein ACOC7J_06440, partial [Armatimonadota bacterium]
FTVLTKNGAAAVDALHHFSTGRDVLACSISFSSEQNRAEWEPGAPPLEDRWTALAEARDRGVDTWISVEPVVHPVEALAVVRRAAEEGVGHVRVGPLNYHAHAGTVDWRTFGVDLAFALEATGIDYYLKRDMREHMPEGFPIAKGVDAR